MKERYAYPPIDLTGKMLLEADMVRILSDASKPVSTEDVYLTISDTWEISKEETEFQLQTLLRAGKVTHKAALPSGKWSISQKVNIQTRANKILKHTAQSKFGDDIEKPVTEPMIESAAVVPEPESKPELEPERTRLCRAARECSQAFTIKAYFRDGDRATLLSLAALFSGDLSDRMTRLAKAAEMAGVA